MLTASSRSPLERWSPEAPLSILSFLTSRCYPPPTAIHRLTRLLLFFKRRGDPRVWLEGRRLCAQHLWFAWSDTHVHCMRSAILSWIFQGCLWCAVMSTAEVIALMENSIRFRASATTREFAFDSHNRSRLVQKKPCFRSALCPLGSALPPWSLSLSLSLSLEP
ncbi:hypothetical protein B0H63DRAFT_70942 [Podospora didyma]|uniref:Uncharacterized protein n=1 Tax=Podospora didyma TaxID=330526 RepID=A0AAE0K173_9PEZI|nr:hypothetical protein B0H63DRAFT_70942 [Podospora didyma]